MRSTSICLATLLIGTQAAVADGPTFRYDPANPESRMAMAECEHKLPDKASNEQRMACYQKEMKYRAEKLMYDAHQTERALKSEITREGGDRQ